MSLSFSEGFQAGLAGGIFLATACALAINHWVTAPRRARSGEVPSHPSYCSLLIAMFITAVILGLTLNMDTIVAPAFSVLTSLYSGLSWELLWIGLTIYATQFAAALSPLIAFGDRWCFGDVDAVVVALQTRAPHILAIEYRLVVICLYVFALVFAWALSVALGLKRDRKQ